MQPFTIPSRNDGKKGCIIAVFLKKRIANGLRWKRLCCMMTLLLELEERHGSESWFPDDARRQRLCGPGLGWRRRSGGKESAAVGCGRESDRRLSDAPRSTQAAGRLCQGDSSRPAVP